MGMVLGRTGVAEPTFEVIVTKSAAALPYQLRKYGVRYVCETENRPGMGFRALAGYIGVGRDAPQNDASKGIPMTAPVVTNQNKRMSFFLPETYDSFAKIPKPTNPNVAITELPPSMGAAHTFTGSCDDARAKGKAQQLIRQLQKDGISLDEKSALEAFELWQFHPPFTIPMLRKNVVWLHLNQDQVNEISGKS